MSDWYVFLSLISWHCLAKLVSGTESEYSQLLKHFFQYHFSVKLMKKRQQLHELCYSISEFEKKLKEFLSQ